MKKNWWIKYIGAVLVVVLIVLSALGIVFRENVQVWIDSGVADWGLLALIPISGALEIIPQYVGPHFVMFSLVLAGMPVLQVLPSVIVGSALGSLIGFVLGKKYGLEVVVSLAGKKKTQRVHVLMNKYGKWFLPIAALSPLPYLPLVFGAFGLSGRRFVLFGLISRVVSYLLLGLFFLLF